MKIAIECLIDLAMRPIRGTGAALCLCLCVHVDVAHAVPNPYGAEQVQLTAREQPIADFLQDLFAPIDLPVAVSPTVKGAVNGSFSGSAEAVFRKVGRAFNLVEYYDGVVLHIYAAQDLTVKTLPSTAESAAQVIGAVREMRLPDARNRIRATPAGTLVVSGTRRFIEQVEEVARAQAVGERSPAHTAVRVFYLRYAWAQDVTVGFAGRQVVVPGVGSIVRAVMIANSRSQVATSSYEQPAPRAATPRARGQAPSRQGTLGAPGADPQAASAPALMAAYGMGAKAPLEGDAGAARSAEASGDMPPAMRLASDLRVEADPRMNAVIVRDSPERMAQYEQLIASLDVEPQAIEIEATIIDVNTDKLRELGVNWRAGGRDGSLLFGRGDSSDLLLAPNTPASGVTPSGRGGFASAVLGSSTQFIARVNALQEQGAARVVSSPQVITLSNVEAVFDNSQTYYVRVAGRDEVDLFNVSAGTVLRVTPHVFKDGAQVRIKLLLSIEDGSLSPRTVDALPVVDRSSINTQALIFEGESLLIGGITRERTSDGTTQVPGLGEIPVLGALFRNNQSSTSRVERMFMISPRLAPRRYAAAADTPAQAAFDPTAPQPSVSDAGRGPLER